MPTDARGSGLPWVEAIARSFEPCAFADLHREVLPALVARRRLLVQEDLRGASLDGS